LYAAVVLTIGASRWTEVSAAYVTLFEDSHPSNNTRDTVSNASGSSFSPMNDRQRQKVRRCLAFGLHEIAQILGSELTQQCLLPLFDSLLLTTSLALDFAYSENSVANSDGSLNANDNNNNNKSSQHPAHHYAYLQPSLGQKVNTSGSSHNTEDSIANGVEIGLLRYFCSFFQVLPQAIRHNYIQILLLTEHPSKNWRLRKAIAK
jgi:hypothetical protein